MLRSRLAGAAFALTLAGALAACGDGGDTVSARAYATDVCGAIKDYTDSVSESVGDIQASQPQNAEEGKELLTTLLRDLIRDTEQLTTEVDDAGVPDVENGERIANEISSALGQVESILEDAEAQVDDLPTDNPQAFAQGTQEIGTSLQESGSEIQSGLDELQSSELEEVSQDIEACQEIEGGFIP